MYLSGVFDERLLSVVIPGAVEVVELGGHRDGSLHWFAVCVSNCMCNVVVV